VHEHEQRNVLDGLFAAEQLQESWLDARVDLGNRSKRGASSVTRAAGDVRDSTVSATTFA
jgi:hypothetical protein